jgi:hypothetical protein
MIFAKGEQRNAGGPPRPDAMAEHEKYNEELVKAGVLLDGAGLQPSSKGARVTFPGGTPRVTDGPFAETKELVAGYWLWQVRSLDEAVEWLKRAPYDGGEFEIRPVATFDAEIEGGRS